jgi:hypothetical protein
MISKCPKCGFAYTITPQHIGTPCHCQQCGQDFTLKEDKPLPSPPPPPQVIQDYQEPSKKWLLLLIPVVIFAVSTGVMGYFWQNTKANFINLKTNQNFLEETNKTLNEKFTRLVVTKQFFLQRFPLYISPGISKTEVKIWDFLFEKCVDYSSVTTCTGDDSNLIIYNFKYKEDILNEFDFYYAFSNNFEDLFNLTSNIYVAFLSMNFGAPVSKEEKDGMIYYIWGKKNIGYSVAFGPSEDKKSFKLLYMFKNT